jgi:hypothetical protein
MFVANALDRGDFIRRGPDERVRHCGTREDAVVNTAPITNAFVRTAFAKDRPATRRAVMRARELGL